MKVREVIALAASNLGRDDLAAAAEQAGAQVSGELKTLLGCYNTVENEIALDYYPLKLTQRMTIADGRIYYYRFERTPVTVYEIRTSAGQLLPFTKTADYLELEKRSDIVTVTYACAPAVKTMTGDCEASNKVSARLLALGVTCEYCLVTGKFQEAELWESKYRDALRATYSVHESFRVRARRWE